jgi:hypothetical protein
MHRHAKRGQESDQVVPYWKRAHTDWRFVLGVVLSLLAITIYVVSDDLTWRPYPQTQQGESR